MGNVGVSRSIILKVILEKYFLWMLTESIWSIAASSSEWAIVTRNFELRKMSDSTLLMKRSAFYGYFVYLPVR
jgi:hypothetical protein